MLLILFLISAQVCANINRQIIKKSKDNGQWIIKSIDLTDEGCFYIDSAIGDNEKYYISYHDRRNECLKVAKIRDNDIDIDIVDSNGTVGLYSSISIDSKNNLHLSYYDETNRNLKYAYWTGLDWEIEIVDKTGDVGLFTSIDTDSNNYPHISYYDDTNKDLKYVYWNGSKWNYERVINDGDIGLATSLVLDPFDSPHISFSDDTYHSLYYAYKKDSIWTIITVDDDCIVFGSTSIDLDNNNYPHIGYFDAGTSEEDWFVKHAYYDNSRWFIEIVDPNLKYFWNDWGISLKIDDFERVHIAYFQWYRWDLNYAYKYNNRWYIETVESQEDVGAYASLVIDSQGYPRIAYMCRSSLELRYSEKIQYNPYPPQKPIGPTRIKPNKSYFFRATGFDFDNDKIKIGWDWDDNSSIEWTHYIESAETVEFNHTWQEKGNYDIKVIILDENDYMSSWSDPLRISVSKIKINTHILSRQLILGYLKSISF
jgi:hypothetical protein